MWIKNSLLLFFFAIASFCGAQVTDLSPKAKISILTCGSGNDLYTTFGHSAIRVHDPVQNMDVVYNYGTFNFDPPLFYVEFVMGKLNYSLSKQDLPYFLYAYELENRWVKEQDLALDSLERNTLYAFLEKNYRPENREYKYDFFYNNCATKIGDVLQEALGPTLVWDETYLKHQFTFRELIHQHLVLNSWSSFGIDLALGSVIDKTATVGEHSFLPDYVLQQLNHATLNGKDLVASEHTILQPQILETRSNFLGTPLFWILVAAAGVIALTYRDFRQKKRSKFIDLALFLVTGLAGLLLCFLWFVTDHTATVNNFNILWVFPLNAILWPLIFRKTKAPLWASAYFLFLLGMLCLTVVLWTLQVQAFSPLIAPLLLMLGIRYLFLWKYFKVP